MYELDNALERIPRMIIYLVIFFIPLSSSYMYDKCVNFFSRGAETAERRV